MSLCECGCGEDAGAYARNGKPKRFIHGHNSRGENHHSWSGGRTSYSAGYVHVLRPEHPRADANGRVREHRLIAEAAVGRLLPEGAVVHHVNGDRADNRNRNLVVCENEGYHRLLHQRAAAYDECGSPGWLRCHYCGKHDEPERVDLYETGQWHRSCRNRYRREKQQAEEAS